MMTLPVPVCPLLSCEPVMSVMTSPKIVDSPDGAPIVTVSLPWMKMPEP